MTEEELEAFWVEYSTAVLPEVGSRALQRILLGESPWIIVQSNSYRYCVDFTVEGHIRVRIVVRDYLAFIATW